MSRKTLAWANKEVETFLCILGEEDVVYDVYVAAAAIDIRPTLKGTVGGGNATSELSWAIQSPPYRTFANRSVPHPAVETRHKRSRIPRKCPLLGFPNCAFCPPQWQVSFCKEEYAVDHSSQQALCNSLFYLGISGMPILSTSDKHLCGNHLFHGASVSLKDTASYYTPPP